MWFSGAGDVLSYCGAWIIQATCGASPSSAADVGGVDVLGTPVGCAEPRRGGPHGEVGEVDLAGASWHKETLSLRHNSHGERVG